MTQKQTQRASHHSMSVLSLRIAAFAVDSSKLASSIESPASASVMRVASAPNLRSESLSVSELPVLLLIFSPLSMR